jgi:hypothetical protein
MSLPERVIIRESKESHSPKVTLTPEQVEHRRAYMREYMRRRYQMNPLARKKAIARAIAYKKAHPEKVRAYYSKPENRERQLRYSKEWANSPKGKEYHDNYARAYYKKNRARLLARTKEWREAHPEHITAYREKAKQIRSPSAEVEIQRPTFMGRMKQIIKEVTKK